MPPMLPMPIRSLDDSHGVGRCSPFADRRLTGEHQPRDARPSESFQLRGDELPTSILGIEQVPDVEASRVISARPKEWTPRATGGRHDEPAKGQEFAIC
jgi:hypothetical protein